MKIERKVFHHRDAEDTEIIRFFLLSRKRKDVFSVISVPLAKRVVRHKF